MRPRRRIERTLLVLSLLLLAWWPFAYRYTSVGFEFEQRVDDGISGTYWRIRWPSDGSIVLARIVHQTRLTADDTRQPDAFDFGATFLKPARPCGNETFWEHLGFWCRSVDAREDNIPDIVKYAERAWVVGMPHALLLLLSASGWWLARNRRRTNAGRKPSVDDGSTSVTIAAKRAADRQSRAGDK